MYTTCLECGKECRTYELDVNSECWMCQAKFENKMKKVQKDTDYKNRNKSSSYFSQIPIKCREAIMHDVVNLYKVKIKNRKLLIEYVNKKYNVRITDNIFSRMTSPQNLRDMGLSWKFELQKLSRTK